MGVTENSTEGPEPLTATQAASILRVDGVVGVVDVEASSV
jgi:hypothetical protein